jgi:Predicted membrane protein (DUF2232)
MLTMSKQLPIVLGLGVVAGVFHAAITTGSSGGMVLAYLSQAPLFIAGLLAAWPMAAAGAAIATLVIAGIAGVTSAGIFVLSSAAPAVFLVRQALRNRPAAVGGVEWYPPGLLLAWLVAMPAVAIIALALFTAGSDGGLEGTVLSLTTAFLATVPTGQPGAKMEQLATLLTSILPGLVSWSWIFMTTVNGILAQGLLSGFQQSQRPSPRLADIVLPSWLLYALAASLLMAVVGDGGLGYTARNVALVVALGFFFQGLGVVHALLERISHRGLALIGFYLLLIVQAWWTVPLVVLLGIIEPFVAIRARFANRPARREEK